MSSNINNFTQARDETPSPSTSASSSSSSPSSSSDSSSSSSELNPSDALQSPLTGLLDFEGFEGFSMTQIRNLGIANLDMPNFPNLPSLPSFNIPRLPQRIPNLANNFTANLSNLQNLTTNIPNLSYLSQLTNVYTSAELQNIFNLSRITTNLPNFPQLPQLPQLPPLFSAAHLARSELFKPWTHLRESVQNMHKRLNDIIECSATNFHFKTYKTINQTDCIRIYFHLNNFIYYCDIPLVLPNKSAIPIPSTNNFDSNARKLNQNQPTPSTSSEDSSSGYMRRRKYSPNTRGLGAYEMLNTQPTQPKMLLKESCKMRRYEYDASSCRFVYSNGNNLYYFNDDPEINEAPHIPLKILTRLNAPKSNFLICPSNPNLIAFYCLGNIWCVNIISSEEFKLNIMSDEASSNGNNLWFKTNGSNSSDTGNPFTCEDPDKDEDFTYDGKPTLVGRPSLVIREEFGRDIGFWWSPAINHTGKTKQYRLLYEETDQSKVEVVKISSCDGNIEEHRFPKAGRDNPISSLKVTNFMLSEDDMVIDIHTTNLPDLKSIFPQCEYLLRAGWLNQDVIWCELLNRKQTHLVIALISISGSFKPQIIFEESNDVYWVRAHDVIYFLNTDAYEESPMAPGTELSFIWSSEESGFRHLYYIKIRLKESNCGHELVTKKQLTDGPWEVSDRDFWVDEGRSLLYFCGLRDTPLENHLYVISFADAIKGEKSVTPPPPNRIRIHRLSEPNYYHSSVAMNHDCSIFVSIQSNISTPPFGFVNAVVQSHKPSRRDHRRLPDSRRLASLLIDTFNHPHIESSHVDNLKSIGKKPSIMYDCQTDLLPGLAKPELFCCQLTSGELIYGSIFKPEFMESGVRYPTVLEIYGGPETQMVSNNFTRLRQPIRHLLSSGGYVVVIIDCRGSGKRGLSFEAHTYHRMGQVEVADQVEVLRWLAKNTGYIDLDRVAINGWSYGGYLSLMALAGYPKVFKVAIAGAPVTNWSVYDSAYTERFMGLPYENQEGYYKGNILNHIHLFPDE